MNLYIDFFSALPQSGGVKYHGGGGYTRNVVTALVGQKRKDVNICVLCPEWFAPTEECEPELARYKDIIWVNVKSPDEYSGYKEGDIVYYPMLGYLYELKEIVKLRKKFPYLKLCATLHDIRFLEYTADWTEKYYETGIKRLLFPVYSFCVNNWAKKIIKGPALRDCLEALDEVYTVSNYSMQKILQQNRNAKISLYYQTVKAKEDLSCGNIVSSEYVLFVSGARPVKNLTHALLAFSKYKMEHMYDDKKMVITGITDEQFHRLCDVPGVDYNLMKQYCVTMGYVSAEELAALYKYCRFVLYTSKNEGFGLPVLEAASYGKTCVASNVASIPEVIGDAVRYVNPLNDDMIADAISFFDSDANLEDYERRVSESWSYLCERMETDQKNFINDLLRQ